MRSPLSRPGVFVALFAISTTASAGCVVLAVKFGSWGGGQVLLMAGTGALVTLILAGLSLAALVEVRRHRAERLAAGLAEANERENNIGSR